MKQVAHNWVWKNWFVGESLKQLCIQALDDISVSQGAPQGENECVRRGTTSSKPICNLLWISWTQKVDDKRLTFHPCILRQAQNRSEVVPMMHQPHPRRGWGTPFWPHPFGSYVPPQSRTRKHSIVRAIWKEREIFGVCHETDHLPGLDIAKLLTNWPRESGSPLLKKREKFFLFGHRISHELDSLISSC
jgi:hypothetical protein